DHLSNLRVVEPQWFSIDRRPAVRIVFAYLGKAHRKKVAWLQGQDALQIFQAFDGTPVQWDHCQGTVRVDGVKKEPSKRPGLDWTSWQHKVNARERTSGRPLTVFSSPGDRGDGTFDDELFVAWPCEHDEETHMAKRHKTSSNASSKSELHKLKLQMWEELLQSQRTSVDLSQHVDLHRGLQNFDKLKDACDLMHLSSIHGELHPTAQCPWMQRPAFHFVLYGCGDFRVLISLARDHYTLIFETTEGGFISINEPPQQSGQMVPPRPRERDICEAFGSRCLDGRRLKAMTDNGKKTAFKDLVAEFLRQRAALSHRGGVHKDASHTLQQVAQHLVRFDGASLRWELVNDKDELLWRKFLWERVLQPQTARLYSHLRTDRLKECVLHVRISESMQRFDAAQSPAEAFQSWKSCCESIQQCRHCARQFEGILQATSYSAAQKQLQYHLWSGQWWLNPDEIFFTHARCTPEVPGELWTTTPGTQEGAIRLRNVAHDQYLFFDGIFTGAFNEAFPDQDWQVLPQAPFYIGGFKETTMTGKGQFFWPNGAPLFKGSLKSGKLVEGLMFDERCICHGHFRFHEDGPALAGAQPDEDLEGEAPEGQAEAREDAGTRDDSIDQHSPERGAEVSVPGAAPDCPPPSASVPANAEEEAKGSAAGR
ncbi:unnamed protein product, partial [Symbiodinium sp. KB8]